MNTTYKILTSIVDDLEQKLKNEPERISGDGWAIQWAIKRIKRDGTLQEEVFTGASSRFKGLFRKRKLGTTAEEEEKEEVVVEKKIKVALTRWQDEDCSKNKYRIDIITELNGDEQIMEMNISWLDTLRPTIRKLKRLRNIAHEMHKEREMLKMDREISKINSNRIDDILLGNPEEPNEKD